MGPFDNSDLPFVSVYHNSSTTTDGVQKDYQIQPDVTIMPPPGAAPTYSPTSILPPQVGLETLILSPTGHYGDTTGSRVSTPPSTDSLSDESDTSLYDHSTSTRNSTSPTLSPSHVHESRRSFPRKS